MDETWSTQDSLEHQVQKYYNSKLDTFGMTAKGVDWKDQEAQFSRFQAQFRLSKLAITSPKSILDYGCGYGAFLEFVRASGFIGSYTGVDIASNMVRAAKTKFLHDASCEFLEKLRPESYYDISFASGTYNVMFSNRKDWLDNFVLPNIDQMLQHSDYAIVSFLRGSPSYIIKNLLYIDVDELRSIVSTDINIKKIALIEKTWEYCVLLSRDSKGD